MDSSNTPLLSSTSLAGTIVENLAGEHIGEILDLMIDTENAEVSYAVLSVATGFLNLGSKYFAIPMEALQVDTENRKLLLDSSKEHLENSPGFDKEHWPKGPQAEFVNSVYAYYNIERNLRHFDSDYRVSAYADESLIEIYRSSFESEGMADRARSKREPLEQSIDYDQKRDPAYRASTQPNVGAATRNLEGVQGSRKNLKYGHQDALRNDSRTGKV